MVHKIILNDQFALVKIAFENEIIKIVLLPILVVEFCEN